MTSLDNPDPSVVLVHGAYADGSSWSWRSRPVWYAVSRRDRTISPELQRFMAERMHATSVEIDAGHLSLVTHPGDVTRLIMHAAQAVRPHTAADAAAPPR